MRSKTAQWFETKVQYEKVQVDGMQKKVTERYVVDALSFTEAESSIIEEMKPYVSGDYKIKNMNPLCVPMALSLPTKMYTASFAVRVSVR